MFYGAVNKRLCVFYVILCESDVKLLHLRKNF